MSRMSSSISWDECSNPALPKIWIRASHLAKFTGDNKYVSDEEAFEDLLSGNPFLASMMGYEMVRGPDTNVEAKLMMMDEKTVSTLAHSLDPSLATSLASKTLDEKVKAVSMKIAEQTRASLVSETETASKEEIRKVISSNPMLKLLSEEMEKDSMISRGCSREGKALDLFQSESGREVSARNDRLMKKNLTKVKGFDVILCGKVDGMLDDGTLVETKNRRNRLMWKIPIYEKVQMEAYMWLADSEKCHHIENFDGKQRETLYERNPRLWDMCVEKLEKFISSKIPDI